MAQEINSAAYKKLVALVKKDPDQSERAFSDASGIPMGQIGKALYMAEVEANPSLAIKKTGAAIANARDKEGIRWPRIAARTGMTVSQVQAEYEKHTGKSPRESYTGRGRNFSGTKAATGGNKSSGGGGGGRGTGRGTSGRRAAAAKADTPTKATGRGRGRQAAAAQPAAGRGRGRNRTRADRAAASGDPK
jgi:hypothetical protein